MPLAPLNVGMTQEQVLAAWGRPHRRRVATEGAVADRLVVETWYWSWPHAMANVAFGVGGDDRTVIRFEVNERLRDAEENA